jgi:starch synthase
MANASTAFCAVSRDRHSGILNGIDTTFFNPATDPHLAATYTATHWQAKRSAKRPCAPCASSPTAGDPPLAAMVTLLASQKGIDLLDAALPAIFAQTDMQLVVLGSGEPHWEQLDARAGRALPRAHGAACGF